MMTDERQGDGLLPSLAAMPRGAGIVFRHYALASAERRALFRQVKAVARQRGLLIVLAGSPELARRWGADGVHGPGTGASSRLLRTASAHNLREVRRAEAAGAHLIFLSPVFATRSHPGARTLGARRFAALARQARRPVVALGGMDAERAQTLSGAYGWAAIDAWNVSETRQKRKAVPT
jgi:thiamine-phosphate pyrophosphorylase